MSRIRKHVAGALLLAATAACSSRPPGGPPMSAPFEGAAASPRPMAGYPLAGHVASGPGAGGETPATSPSVEAVPPLVPIETGPFVREVAPGSPGLASVTGLASFSPDGAWYAYAYRREGAGEAILHVGPVAGPARSTDYVTSGQIFWSPDGRRLAFAQLLASQFPMQKYALRSWDIGAQRAGTLVDSVEVMAPWMAWVDGGVVFVEGSDLVFQGQDANPVRLSGLADAHSGVLGAQAVYPSPDGKRLAFLAPATGFTAAASLVVHDLETGEARAIRRVPKDLSRLVWAETGDALGYLAGGYGQYELHRVHISDGAEEVTPFYLGEPVVEKGANWTSVTSPYASDLSPNLKWCLVNRGGPLYAREMATGKHVQLTSGQVHPLTWTADSRHIFAYIQGGAPERVRYYKIQVER